MKVVLMIGFLLRFSLANPNPSGRSLSCSGFPKQLSGRLYMVKVDDSGSTEAHGMTFSIDMNLERMQKKMGDKILIMDYKEGKIYEISPDGCQIDSSEEKSIPEFLEDLPLSLVAKGSLGSKGALVELYSFQDGEEGGVVTLESGDQCIPASYAVKTKHSAISGSFLDLKTTVDPGKLIIPEKCKQEISRRSFPALSWNALSDAFTLLQSHINARKQGFPWILENKNERKRGFPWILGRKNGRKRGFPWVKPGKLTSP
ncbi:hypothetical protein pdam_00016015 [Pocillopora damicornis]|uniref:Uncharacterized protein n=1 Tax=Pocillopora damicornis TaxID=46731 RepID=A0A3M6UUW2_POCDA|nr:hypothetical protein pdam_00016015 [Pocillopora damicornis]